MKKTLIVLMMVLLAAMLMVSCDDNNKGGSEALPTVSKAGDVITLGSRYSVEIKWVALSVDTTEKKALLISQNVLENMVFSSSKNVKYSESNIHTYLTNLEEGGFIKNYGLSTEYMLKVEDLSAEGITEKDYVFLLSKDEATTGYFENKTNRISGNSADWWVRSLDTSSSTGKVALIDYTGDYCISEPEITSKGLRPAFWYTWE